MGIDPVTATLGSAAIGAIGAKSSKPKAPGAVDPYMFPQVKTAITEELLPRAAEQFGRGYPARPMMRAVDPANDPFASKALFQLQQARDAERVAGAGKPQATAPAATASPSAIDKLREDLGDLMRASVPGMNTTGLQPTFNYVGPDGREMRLDPKSPLVMFGGYKPRGMN